MRQEAAAEATAAAWPVATAASEDVAQAAGGGYEDGCWYGTEGAECQVQHYAAAAAADREGQRRYVDGLMIELQATKRAKDALVEALGVGHWGVAFVHDDWTALMHRVVGLPTAMVPPSGVGIYPAIAGFRWDLLCYGWQLYRFAVWEGVDDCAEGVFDAWREEEAGRPELVPPLVEW